MFAKLRKTDGTRPTFTTKTIRHTLQSKQLIIDSVHVKLAYMYLSNTCIEMLAGVRDDEKLQPEHNPRDI